MTSQRPDDLLSREQLEGMAEIWARPRYVHGVCVKCGKFHQLLDPKARTCPWCERGQKRGQQ
jgi:hypothetical protein